MRIIEQAVSGAMMGIFFNQGQVCCAGSRLFVEETVKDEFLDKLKEKSAKIVVGDPMDKATHMGPQVSEEQLNRIKGYVDIAREEGATVVAGGESPQLEGAFQKGYFFQPTIFSDVKNKMRVAQEEIFGPVVSVISFKDEDDLIKQANDTIYGLSAGIWTQRHHARASLRERDQGGRDLDQYLQHVQCRVSLWWLQAVRLRPGNGQARAGAVHASEERLGGSFGQADWLVWKVASIDANCKSCNCNPAMLSSETLPK